MIYKIEKKKSSKIINNFFFIIKVEPVKITVIQNKKDVSPIDCKKKSEIILP